MKILEGDLNIITTYVALQMSKRPANISCAVFIYSNNILHYRESQQSKFIDSCVVLVENRKKFNSILLSTSKSG